MRYHTELTKRHLKVKKMRQTPGWMTMTDLIILEFLSEHDLELAPTPLHRNLERHGYDVGYSTIKGRLSKLERRELLTKDSDGYYELTKTGIAYLSGELSSEDLENG